jgi:long-chain fatty acid transport protein
MKKIFISCVIFTTPLTAQAAGFALIEQSASGMGNAFAGGSAIAEDASTIFFNPAGMTYLPDTQLVIAGHAIKPSADFSNNGSHLSPLIPAPFRTTTGSDGGDAGDLAFVPNLFFTKAITPEIRLGIGLSAPFGLKTEYDNGWVGRYQALKTELNTININPSIGFKVSDKLSLGFGISAMRADATLTSAVDFGTICGSFGGCGIGALPQRNDGTVTLKGDNWAWGWNAGGIFQLTDDTRLGLAYRSQVHQRLEGTVSYGGVPALLAASPNFSTGPISASIALPDSLSASVFSKVSDQWDVMGDVTFTQWSTFKNLTAVRSTGAVVTSIPENWENTYRISAGASYHYSDALKLRAGLAFDESPVQSQFRTPRIPDNNRTWLAFGANYKFNPDNSIDAGYTHIFVNNSSINKINDSAVAALRDSLIGSYDNSVDILSLQYTHNF